MEHPTSELFPGKLSKIVRLGIWGMIYLAVSDEGPIKPQFPAPRLPIKARVVP